ncbi:MAG: methylated-DNA--[protein]-cysteine S-methyltransferase [Treponema sp.]|jgi:methylated-DNA-[protein]-cysteine S-methyltransferase|nr:methylated-DNA--[protein]-cysteine S-methyltransferase [Treponema sp.]
MIYTCTIDTFLGTMRGAAENDALTGLWFIGQKYYPQDADTWFEKPDYGVFQALRDWLEQYFAGNPPEPNVLLRPHGTAFQQAVWEILQTIPYGKTGAYGEIAEQTSRRRGAPVSAQAIGGAVGHNPISLLIPCHRVIGSDGSLTGYAGGIEKKKALLELEQRR